MKFQKGNPGGPGRPEGSKTKNCMNPVFWFNMLDDCLKVFDEKERMPHVFHALELLMPKVPILPASPGDSASNAIRTLELLNISATAKSPLESNPRPLPNDPTSGNGGPNGA